MYFQDSSSCLLCAGDVHEEQEITTDIGDSNIREVIVINNENKYFVKIPKVSEEEETVGSSWLLPNTILLHLYI